MFEAECGVQGHSRTLRPVERANSLSAWMDHESRPTLSECPAGGLPIGSFPSRNDRRSRRWTRHRSGRWKRIHAPENILHDNCDNAIGRDTQDSNSNHNHRPQDSYRNASKLKRTSLMDSHRGVSERHDTKQPSSAWDLERALPNNSTREINDYRGNLVVWEGLEVEVSAGRGDRPEAC